MRALGAIALVVGSLLLPAGSAAAAVKDPCLGRLDCPTLTVELLGNGSGSWESTDASYVPDGKISCQRNGGVTFGACSHAFANGTYWRVLPTSGSIACDRGSCVRPDGFRGHLGFSQDITYQGTVFTLLTPATVSVSRSGSGTVTSVPVGIDCGTSCSTEFGAGTDMALKAVAGAGYSFGSWTGPCAGQDSSCTFVLSQAGATTTATFTENAAPAPTPEATASPTRTPSKTARPTATAKSSLATTTVAAASPSGSAAQSPEAGSTTTAVVVSTPAPTLNGAPAAESGAGMDLTPIILAILVAGLLAGGGFAWFAHEARRRPR